MSTFTDKMAHHQWRDGANLILGVWLALSPTILGYMHDASPAVNAVLVGIVIAAMAVAALITFHKWEEWINVVLALWLIASPFALEYTAHTAALWNQVVTGVLVGCLALWTAITEPEPGVTA